MLKASLSFFILAIFAYIFGAYGIAGISVDIGKTLLIVFLVLATFSFLGSLFYGKNNNLLMLPFILLQYFAVSAVKAEEPKISSESNSSTLKSGLFIEPSITYDLGGSTTDYPSPFQKADGDINGFGLGARLGVHVQDALFAGIDGRFSFPTFKENTLNYDTNAKALNLAPVIGFQMPDIGIRVWGSYILLASLDPDAKNGLDLKYSDGTGYRIGAGFRVAMVSLNLEYQHLKYDKTTLESIGSFTTNSSFNNVKLSSNSWIVSVSSPLEF